MRLGKGLALVISISIAMFLAGFAGGVFSAPGPGFTRTETVTKQVPVLLTETTTIVDTTTVAETITEAKSVTVTTTMLVTATATETVFMPTTTTATRTITLSVNMPVQSVAAPYARVSRGSGINIGSWVVSVAMSYRQVATNITSVAAGNQTATILENATYTVVVLQMLNSAPWARTIDASMFSKVILVTNTSRSYEPIALNASQGFIAPGSYGFIELRFLVEEDDHLGYLYTEIMSNGMLVRVEFEL